MSTLRYWTALAATAAALAFCVTNVRADDIKVDVKMARGFMLVLMYDQNCFSSLAAETKDYIKTRLSQASEADRHEAAAYVRQQGETRGLFCAKLEAAAIPQYASQLNAKHAPPLPALPSIEPVKRVYGPHNEQEAAIAKEQTARSNAYERELDRREAIAREQARAWEAAHPIQQSCTVGLSEYYALNTGIDYTRAARILGCWGEELSQVNIPDAPFTVMYMWKGSALGANMNATFQGGKLISKAQFGLQ